MHISELLDHRPERVEAWSTGLRGLDSLTGGFTRGQLWVVTGAPGTGKTDLLTQFVYRLATDHDFTVQFHAARSDPIEEVRARLLALSCHHPRRPGQAAEPTPVSSSAGFVTLRDVNLHVYTGGGWSVGRDWGDADRVCLAVDEPEFNRPPALARAGLDELRRFADRPGIVIVTAPRSHCVEWTASRDRLREEWASVADVMVEIVQTDTLGGAVLRVVRNRTGPVGPVSAVHQSHLARFVQSEEH